MASGKTNGVGDYLKNAPQPARAKLKQLRAIIKATAPRTDEDISYGMPYYKYEGAALAGFAAFKNHIGFFPGAVVRDFKTELAGYETARGSVRLPLNERLPVALIRVLIKAGMKRTDARSATKRRK